MRSTALATLRRHWPLVFPILFEAAVFRAWLGPGVIVGNDFTIRSPSELLSLYPWPHAWSNGFQIGENQEVYMFAFPLLAAAGLIAKLGGTWPLIERLIYLWPYLALSIAGPYALAIRLTRSPVAAAAATMVFGASSWTVALVQRGHIPSVDAAAFIPIVAVAVLHALDRPSWRSGGIVGVLLALQTMYDIRYVYISTLLIAFILIEALVRKRLRARLRMAAQPVAACVLVYVAISLYWIVPQILSPVQTSPGYGSLADYLGISSYLSVGASVALFDPYYGFHANDSPFAVTAVPSLFFILPALAFAGFAVAHRARFRPAFAAAGVLGLILCAGPAPPLGAVGAWMYQHVPGMSLFRDMSRFFSLLSVAYAIGIASAIVRLEAFARLRGGAWTGRRCSAAAAAAFAACYVVVLGDALNPARQSNFSSAPPAADQTALESFIDDQAPYARTLIFPRSLQSMRPSTSRPRVEAVQLVNTAAPFGFRELNPDLYSTFGFFASPLAWTVLRELNVRYVVVPYDPQRILYSNGRIDMQYREAVDFCRSLTYLRYVRAFGRNVVFELRGWSPDRAFVAEYPVAFAGTAHSLESLLATPFWGSKPAVLMAGQNPDVSVLSAIPNVVLAKPALDPAGPTAFPVVPSDYIRFADQAQAMRVSYRAYAAAAYAMTASPYDWDETRGFDFTFATTATTRSTIQDAIDFPRSGPAHGIADLVSHPTPGATIDRGTPDPLWDRSGYTIAPSASWLGTRPSAKGFGPGPWFELRGSSGYFEIVDPSPYGEIADVKIPAVVSLTPSPSSVRVHVNGKIFSFLVPPSGVGWFLGGGVPLTLSSAPLLPGANKIWIELAGGYSRIAFRGDVGVSRQQPLPAPRVAPLSARIRTYGHGAVITTRPRMRAGTEERASFKLLEGVEIPLDRNPVIDIAIAGACSAIVYQVDVGLADAASGSGRTLTVNVRSDGSGARLDVRRLTDAALDSEFRASANAHAADWGWLNSHFTADQSDGATAYSVRDVSLVARKPAVVDASTVAAPCRAVVHKARLETTSDWLGSAYTALTSATSFADRPRSYVAHATPTGTPRAIARIPIPRRPSDAQELSVFAKPARMWTLAAYAQGTSHACTVPAAESATDPWPRARESLAQPREISAPNSADWYRYVVDLADVCGDGSIDRSSLRTLSIVSSAPTTVHDGDGSVGLSVARLTYSRHAALAAAAARDDRISGIELDGTALVQRSGGRRVGNNLYLKPPSTVTLSRGAHEIASRPLPAGTVAWALAGQGRPARFRPATATGFTDIEPTEFSAHIDSDGGLLVTTTAYDPGWRLALATAAYRPSGFALLDWLSLRRRFVDNGRHYVATNAFNAWLIPRGSADFVGLFVPDAWVQLGALMSLVIGIPTAWFAVRRRR